MKDKEKQPSGDKFFTRPRAATPPKLISPHKKLATDNLPPPPKPPAVTLERLEQLQARIRAQKSQPSQSKAESEEEILAETKVRDAKRTELRARLAQRLIKRKSTPNIQAPESNPLQDLEKGVVTSPPQSAIAELTKPTTPAQTPEAQKKALPVQPEIPDMKTLDLQGNQIAEPDQPIRIISDHSVDFVTQMLHIMRNDVVEVLLMDNNITSLGAGHLSRALLQTSKLRTLYLFNNPDLFKELSPANEKIDDFLEVRCTGAMQFSQLLKEHTTLNHLDINHCGLTPLGACLFARGLLQNRSLSFLDIGHSNLMDDGVGAICRGLENHPNIHRLHLDATQITEIGAGYVLELLQINTRIVEIGLNDNKISEALMAKIEQQIEANIAASNAQQTSTQEINITPTANSM